jgi:hypothetical protein
MVGTLNDDWRGHVLEARRPPAEIPRIYSRPAPVYELWARLAESRPRRRVLELAAPGPGENVLEVATGTGVQLVELARRPACAGRSDPAEQRPEDESRNEVEEGKAADDRQLP